MSNNYNNIGDINKGNDSINYIKSYNDNNNKSIINSINNLSINESNNSNLIGSKSTEYSSIIDFENNEKIFDYIIYNNKNEKKIKNSIIIVDETEQNKIIYEKIINNYYNIKNKETNNNYNKICFLILENKKLEKLCADLKLVFKNKKISILQGGKGKKLKNDFDIFINVFKETDIFVAIPDVFYKLLSIGFIKIYQFSILFLNDCHLCEGNHPYNNIMQEFYYYYLYRHFELKININHSLPNIIGFSHNQFLYEKIMNKDDKCIKLLTNLSENLNCQIIISPQILSKNENNNNINNINNINIENIEYIKTNNHLNNNNIDTIYKILNHYFINKVLDLIINNHIKQKKQSEEIKKNYLDIIKKKFYSKDKEEYIKVKSLQKSINNLLKDSFIFHIFEDILKYLIYIFQNFDLEQIKELLKKYLIVLQNYLTVKKNEEENFKKLKEEIIFLIGIIKDSINACEYLLNNKINYINDRYIKFISYIESINIINNKNAKILIIVSSRKLAFLLNELLNKKKYKSDYIINTNTKNEKSIKISLLKESTYNIIEEINKKYNTDEINILICTSSIYDFIQINKCDYIIVFKLVGNLTNDYIKIKKLALEKKSKLIIISTNTDDIKNIFDKNLSNFENYEIVKDFRRNNFLEEKIQIIGKNNYYFIEETQAKVSIKNSIMLFNDINNWFITQNKKIIVDKFVDEFCVNKIKKYKCKIELDKTFGEIKIFSHSYGDKQSAEADCYLQLISFFHKYGTIDNNLRIIDS